MLILSVEEGFDAFACQSGNQSGELWSRANGIICRTMFNHMVLVLNLPRVTQGAHPSTGIEGVKAPSEASCSYPKTKEGGLLLLVLLSLLLSVSTL